MQVTDTSNNQQRTKRFMFTLNRRTILKPIVASSQVPIAKYVLPKLRINKRLASLKKPPNILATLADMQIRRRQQMQNRSSQECRNTSSSIVVCNNNPLLKTRLSTISKNCDGGRNDRRKTIDQMLKRNRNNGLDLCGFNKLPLISFMSYLAMIPKDSQTKTESRTARTIIVNMSQDKENSKNKTRYGNNTSRKRNSKCKCSCTIVMPQINPTLEPLKSSPLKEWSQDNSESETDSVLL